MPSRNVIPFPFPASPPFAQPRKRGARSHVDLQARIASNLPLLIVPAQALATLVIGAAK